jgi:hypothetical protein
MSPSSDKTINVDKVLQVAPKEFYDAYAKHNLEQGVTVGKKILYECMSDASLEEVIHKLTGPAQVVNLKEAVPRYIIVFGFTLMGDPSSLLRAKVTKMHTTDYVTFDDDNDDAMTMDGCFHGTVE